MATFVKRPGPRGVRWRAVIRRKGHEASDTFSSKAEAEEWAIETEAEIDKGKFTRVEALRHNVKEMVDRYLSDVAPSLKSRRERIRHLRWWEREIGQVKLAHVTPALIAEKRDALARGETVRGVRSGATVNRYLAALSHAFTMAVKEWGWMDSNPVRSVSRKKEPRGRVRFLDDDELKRLLRAAKESDDPRLFPLLVLSLSTGLRQGEALRLRWRDVDLREGVAVIDQTKNEDRRAVPVTGFAAEVLQEFRKVQSINKDALVFADTTGSDEATFPRWEWERALNAAKIEDFRWHDTRHCAASALAQSGASLMEIAQVLGHRTLQMVMRYSHLTHQTTTKAVARATKHQFGRLE